MLFRMQRDGGNHVFQRFRSRSAGELGLREKDLENWIAKHPELLFGSERVLVFAQSVSGQSMADILALDTSGRVVVVEMKRDWSDRSTVGQLLEYAAAIALRRYEGLAEIAQQYGKQSDVLLEQFREFVDDETIGPDQIGKAQRLCIVAPASDTGLRNIVEWLKEGGILVDFVPFTLYSNEDRSEVFLDIEPVPAPPMEVPAGEWQGDWFFNTNETYAPGAYKKMFEEGVIAICEYETGPENLAGSQDGQRVFAYVNQMGVLAVGKIRDSNVEAGSSVFDRDNEFHVRVEWTTVVPEEKGVTNAQVKTAREYNLPVRSVFCGMSRHDVADWIEQELKDRSMTEETQPNVG